MMLFSNDIFDRHETAFVCFVLFQVLFTGSQQCFENYQTTRFYGTSGNSHSTCKVIQQNLIPLLKSTVQMLEENSKSCVSTETSETASTSQGTQDALMTQEGELTVVDPATLSTREFVIYQYGISILQFLRFHIDALKACLSETFSLRLQLSAVPQGDESSGISQMLLKEEPFFKEDINLISQLFEVKVKSITDTEAFEKNNFLLHTKSEEPPSDKLLMKKKEHFLHALTSYEKGNFGWRTRFEEETCTSLSASELEDRVDVLTEELVDIIEDEHQFLNSEGNEDLLFYYLEITSLEKDCLVKQIDVLEEKIALGRKV
ncbi:hypothetical protein llap_7589 [Limosa lapponica baueri]|uniref:Uncharacterized protein n=1 Tax=Limosa lapponica baueri TaxID=1758121 RepID=A0A2I0U7R9_LIMLA|nr:hypothetical protein llap_7589 [Limosa lapponica baueri]